MNEVDSAPPPLEATLVSDGNALATRWSRLCAAFIDVLIVGVLASPVLILTGGMEDVMNGDAPSVSYMVLLGMIKIVVFVLIQVNLLITQGQTLGKKVLKIKIVDLDGKLPTLNDHLLKRYAVYLVPWAIPGLSGVVIQFVDLLYIFGNEQRCVHDLVAATRVIKC